MHQKERGLELIIVVRASKRPNPKNPICPLSICHGFVIPKPQRFQICYLYIALSGPQAFTDSQLQFNILQRKFKFYNILMEIAMLEISKSVFKYFAKLELSGFRNIVCTFSIYSHYGYKIGTIRNRKMRSERNHGKIIIWLDHSRSNN